MISREKLMFNNITRYEIVEQLSATDILALTTMKNAAKCDT